MEGVRRRLTLSDQMSILDASNLRDLLRIRDDEDGDGRNALAGLTLGAVLGCEEIIRPNPFQQQQQQQQQQQPSRTLLDIIKDEESGAVYREINVDNTNNNNNNDNNKQKSWKSFKDRLCLRRAGAAWSSSSSSNHHHHPVSDCDFSPDDCRMEISGPSLTGFQRSSFSLISRTSVSTTAPVENVTDFDERESTTIEENNAISSDVTESTNIAPSEPVVMRLSTALAAEREEQRQAASSETQLEERESTDQSQLEEERESTVEVAEQEGDQRGVNVVSIGQQQQEQPLRVSLMALLEETMDHRQSEMILLDEEEEEEEEGMEGGEEVVVAERQRGGRKEEYICCVCMVRHKGAAFIPCGHTFCRLCSRKLWVNRGNCPLCNGFILEILDIF